MDYSIEEAYRRLANAVIKQAWKDAQRSKRMYEKAYAEFLEIAEVLPEGKLFEKAFRELCAVQTKYKKSRDWFLSDWFDILSGDLIDGDALIEKLDAYKRRKL